MTDESDSGAPNSQTENGSHNTSAMSHRNSWEHAQPCFRVKSEEAACYGESCSASEKRCKLRNQVFDRFFSLTHIIFLPHVDMFFLCIPFIPYDVHQSKHATLFSYLHIHKLKVKVLEGTAELGQGHP